MNNLDLENRPQKFIEDDIKYFEYMDELEKMNFSAKDLMFNYPVFAGHVNMARYMFFYDLYKKTLELNGNIADVGTYKGASFLYFAKMVKLFEPYNNTQVHGFDWFQGMKPSEFDDKNQNNKYVADYDLLKRLIKLQSLENIAILNKIDLVNETDKFFEERPYIRFKMAFIDCGIKNVLEKVVPAFFERLVNGGILILDHYNDSASPSESAILEKTIGNNLIKQMPFNRQPTAYIIKGER